MTPQQIRYLLGLNRAADSWDGVGDLAEFFPEVDWAKEKAALEAEERAAWEQRQAQRDPKDALRAAELDAIFREVWAERLSEELLRPNPLMDPMRKNG